MALRTASLQEAAPEGSAPKLVTLTRLAGGVAFARTSDPPQAMAEETKVRRFKTRLLNDVQYYKAIPSFFCIASRVIPLVSGKKNKTTKNCTAIMAAKKANGTQI